MFIIMLVFFALIIGAMIAAAIILPKSPKSTKEYVVKIPTNPQFEQDADDVAKIRSLLRYSNISREQRAHLFVTNGVCFMKGPFRNLENFNYEELGLLPTNEELEYAKSKLRINELESEIEQLKTKQSPFEEKDK